MKVLILCHPQVISIQKNKIQNHWYGSIIEGILFKNGITNLDRIIFETVDILPGGTYRDDCFSENFISSHIEEYNFIFMPDCGGLWYTLQETLKEDDFKDLLRRIVKMSRSSSSIVVDKFMYPIYKEYTIETLTELRFFVDDVKFVLFDDIYSECILAYR